MNSFFGGIGSKAISFIGLLGKMSLLFLKVLSSIRSTNFRLGYVKTQIDIIGVQSLPMILFTSFFMGMVLAYSSGPYLESKLSGISAYMGGAIVVSFVREIGPVITALLIAGRCGSSMAAEIGSMRVTEQIDALVTMGVNPFAYLLLPRVLAGLIGFPILVFFADLSGVIGGSVVATMVVGQTSMVYFSNALQFLDMSSFVLGFSKSLMFGLIVTFVSSIRGFLVYGGAEAVGFATTKAVVESSIVVVLVDYFLTALLS